MPMYLILTQTPLHEWLALPLFLQVRKPVLRDYDKCSESHFSSVEEMDPNPTSSSRSLSETVMLPRATLRALLSLK